MPTATEDKAMANARPSSELSPDKLLDMLYMMMLIRRFEERTMQSYMQQKIGGFCHIYIGQEAVATGSIAALEDADPVITAYRDHGHALARGMHPNYAMAELFGKLTGCAKGKGGSMHFFDKPRHMYGGHAIVGGQCPLGVGLAFATQYNQEDKVTVCYLGDGAINQGAFHESMNMAAIWRLPIIFVVENNMYSMGTHIARGTAAADDLGKKAAAYDMRYAECNGSDILEVYDTFKREADKTRGSTSKALGVDEEKGEGPCFINVKTYRYQGHSMSDPQKYRTKDEVKEQQQQDAINLLVNYLIEHDHASQEKIDELDKKAKDTAQASVKYAESAPEPGIDELYTDVFSEPFGDFKKGELPAMIRNDNSGE
ncbi:MAG: pyruvate dehydrogenase (acetyl-transferring) E1 component subunit alpha [Phycisphaeraceae bacterium]